MIPILYDSSETAFVSNGLGRLRDCISCVVTEERNGIYECDFEYPVNGAHFDEITPGKIIAVTHDDTGDVQPFDVVSFSRPISGVVTFHAVHISYRQSGMVANGTNINSLADAFTMLEGAEPSNPFTYTTDFTSTAYMAAADGTPRSVRQFLGGIEGSILDSYGGEFEWDGFQVILHKSRGVARNFSIRYGVNMLNYQEDTDYQGAYTSCVPYWVGSDTDGNEIKVIGDRVDIGQSGYAGRNDCVPLDLTDKFETKPTKAQVEAEALAQMQANQSYLPTQTISIDFVRLQDMGYEDLAGLMTCRLCDTINVVFPFYNTIGQYKIVKTTWDALADRFESLDLGSLPTTLSQALGISNTLDRSTGGGGGGELYPIGSIYLSVNSTDPGTLFGGTWSRIKDTFLLAAGDVYTAGDTGGESTHTLIESELPKVTGYFDVRRYATSAGTVGATMNNGGGAFTVTAPTSSANGVNGGGANTSGIGVNRATLSFGNNGSHNNMPPYLAVYVWQRVA